MSFLTQIRLGAWLSKILSKILRTKPLVPKFKVGDLIAKVRPASLEEWEKWDGFEPMEILAVGKNHYKLWYQNAEKFKSTYSKLDLNNEPYTNWPFESTEKEYEKIGVSSKAATSSFDTELSDLIRS
jgi:hypothetical protein